MFVHKPRFSYFISLKIKKSLEICDLEAPMVHDLPALAMKQELYVKFLVDYDLSIFLSVVTCKYPSQF